MPNWKLEIRQRLAPLRLSPTREQAIVEELAQDLDDCYAELLARGVAEADAYQQTLAELSDREWLAWELQRGEAQPSPDPIIPGTNRRTNMIADLWQDVVFGGRMLSKAPGFSLIALVILALGIGANTTIFSLLDALFLRPLPGIAEQERLVEIGMTTNGQGFSSVSFPDYRDYVAQNSTFTGIAAKSEQTFHLGTDKTALRLKGEMVTGNYFAVLGVQAKRGRLLQPSEAEGEGANPVAVISERLWQQQFNAEENIAGTTISLNAHPYTIIGVAAGLRGTELMDENTDVWIPITMWRDASPWMAQTGVDWLNSRSSDFASVIGRLKPGVAIQQAQADIDVIAAQLGQAYPKTNAKRGARLVAGLGMSPGDRTEMQRFVTIQFGLVILVLLLACANVAGLLLARTATRQKEIGVRLALGAGRGRIMRQLLTESALLALLGGAFALLVAYWLTDWLRAFLPDAQRDMRDHLAFAWDGRVLGFTLGVAVVTGLLFGLAPALQASKVNLLPLLKDAGGAAGRSTRTRLRNGLVVAQIALSLLLLVSAGLFVRSLQKATAIQVGFATENVLTARLDLGRQNYAEAQGRVFYDQLLERMRVLPGVEAASLAASIPLTKSSLGNNIEVVGQPSFNIRYNLVTPAYLDTLGIPLVAGRHFNEQDKAGAARVAIINEALARFAWPNENPVGKTFTWNEHRVGKQTIEVIGVARDTKGHSLFDDVYKTVYLPLAQRYNGGMTLHLRTATKPAQLIAAVQQELRALDAKLPLYSFMTLEDYRRDALSIKRIQALLIGGFGALALVLASLGLYGVLSFSVAGRTPEIGLRMALGASVRDVLWLIVRQGMTLALSGIAIGLVGAFAATRWLRSLLFGVSTTDPLTFVGIVVVLMLVALLACWLPARRAAKVDPLVALRCE